MRKANRRIREDANVSRRKERLTIVTVRAATNGDMNL
jgi:hypothetical protein